MPDTLVSTKLHIPRPYRELASRPRLTERLDAGLRGKLTLASAPAGPMALSLKEVLMLIDAS